MLTATTLVVWEQWVRDPLISITSAEVESVREAIDAPTEYELWLASEETKKLLEVQFKKHQIAQRQAELEEAQAELELKKEEIRKQEVGL